jgi:hypothetical protein
VASVNGSVNFDSSQKFVIQPGLAASFPWLSVEAKQWQQYRFHRLCFRYVTRTSTSEKGSVILSPDYNPNETPPVTEQEASNTQDAVEDVVWRNLECKLDTSSMFPIGPRKQIRSVNVAGDKSVYDGGRLFICVVGEDSSDGIGKLWVDYDVEFFVPQSTVSQALGPTRTSEFSRDTALTITTATLTPFNFSVTDYDPLNIGDCAAGIFTPPAGCYRIQGHISVQDDTQEAFSASCYIYQDGVNTGQTSYFTGFSGAAVQQAYCLPIDGIVTCDGTTTFSIVLNLAGAAGALTYVTGTATLLISLA